MTKLSTTKFTQKGRTKSCFANYPSAKVYKKSTGSSWVNHLLFGDYIKITNDNIVDGRVKVRSRNSNGWMNITDLIKERILEVNFVDIGQGDGCHIVTPDDQHIIIDAGKTDNMNRYLSWRFNLYDKESPVSFPFTVVISHSDSDHYYGFYHVFKNKKITVNEIFHNGLVERPGNSRLGKQTDDKIFGLVDTTSQMKRIILNDSNRKGTGSLYCKTLYQAIKANPQIEFKSLSLKNEFFKEFDSNNEINNKEFSIRVLGPIRSKSDGKEYLTSIKDLGKDKNGHSVLFRVQYKYASILLGGDVNEEFGKIIHDYYKRKDKLELLRVDIAKACHHGSNHFHYDFIKTINALGTVISSGDEESYSHPRPDTIGALGKCGYGDKPLIFSTELARSTKEITKKNLELIAKNYAKLSKLNKIKKSELSVDELKKLKKDIVKLNKDINSYQTKYGMINVRTNGEKMIVAQKLEIPASYGKWDIHELKYSTSKKRFELKK